MHITDDQYTIATLSQAIADELPQATVWMALAISDNGQQFDTAISASIRLNEIVQKARNFDMSAKQDPVSNSISVGGGDDVARQTCRGIYVGTTGTVVYISPAGDTITKLNVAEGVTHPWQATTILSSSTAGGMWMEY